MISPIIVLGNPRSGTSLIMALLQRAGAWVGTCNPGNAKYPSGTLENIHLRRAMGQMFKPAIVSNSNPFESRDAWVRVASNIIVKDGYNGGPWAVKHSLRFWPAWVPFQPKWVLTRRHHLDILKGLRRKGNTRPDKLILERLKWNEEQLDRVDMRYQALNVYSDKMIHGNEAALKELLSFTGLNCDVTDIMEVVRPELWGRAI